MWWGVGGDRLESQVCIYLSERLERAIGQGLHLIELAHVGGHSEDIGFAIFGLQCLGGLLEFCRIDIGQYDFQAFSAKIQSQRDEYARMYRTYAASSQAAASPIPLAAPVIRATRPEWMAAWLSSLTGERTSSTARRLTRVETGDNRAMEEVLLCGSRPLFELT